MLAEAERFRLGVNYWPADTAMDWLARYDGAAVRRDFSRICEAGMDTVRVFLRWEDLQPTATTIDRRAVSAVVDTADAAAATGLDLVVTLFTGHMSGVNWIPVWATGGDEGDLRFRVVSGGTVQADRRVLRNWYADADLVDAQAHLANAVASSLGGHPALWAWDLGNENSNCTIPPDAAAADRWLERMSSILRSHAPTALVTIGTHMEDLEDERVLGPSQAAPWCDFVCMHGYPIYADWSDGPTDERLVPFLAEVTAWLAGGAPVLFAEFGHSTASPGDAPAALQIGEAAAAAYAGTTLDALQQCGSIGALAWCYSDYDLDLHDRPPFDLAVHERTFGLWRRDGTAKPAVEAFSARRGRSRCPASATSGWLDITVDEFTADRRRHLARLYDRYRSDKAVAADAPTARS